MIIIVDGYNMAHAIMHKGFIDENDRLWFLKLLNTYAKKKKHHIQVVFDSNAVWTLNERYSDLVTITYTRAGITADEIIIEKSKELKNKEVMVVSSDRELCKQVIASGHGCIGSMHFYNLIKEVVGNKAEITYTDTSIKKYVDENDIDLLMKEGTKNMLIKKEEEEDFARKTQGKTVKKAKRTVLKKIKKL